MNDYKIIKDKTFLKLPTKKCTLEEGKIIGEHLKKALQKFGGIGLSANQIGYDKQVCLIKTRENSEGILFINPIITSTSFNKIVFSEGCLSLPGHNVFTIRHIGLKVKSDNIEEELTFGPTTLLPISDYNQGKHFGVKDDGLLECICVQHEIGHLNGELITDSSVRFIPKPPKKVKVGRNEKVLVENKKTKETQFIKYKVAQELLSSGWEII